jgi:3-oxoacyl-[acyl-carrier protein] reductase
MTHQRKAFVTGASRGIGAAIAQELARRGYEIWAPSRAELNLGDAASVKRFIDAHAEAQVDVLVNNAGINLLKALPELDSETWAEMLQVNLTAPLTLTQWAAPFMRSQKWGRILNLSSVLSLLAKEKRAAYSMTKSAINALTRTAAVELGPDGILVNALCPGYVGTEMTSRNNSPAALKIIIDSIPLRRLAQPVELARVAGFLCSEENTYLTGQSVVVDGGYTSQ